MTPPEDRPFNIEDEAEKFPAQMALIKDVFAFSFDEAAKVAEKFSCNADLFTALEQVKRFIEASDLPAEEIEELISLMGDEAEVISFSQATRSSVISL